MNTPPVGKRLSASLLGVFLLLLVAYIFCLPRQLFRCPYSTVVVDRKGEMLGARIAADGQWRFPAREDVPEKIKACLLEFEDGRFYYHWGIDPLAMGRAIRQNIHSRRVVSGGSTLTMQAIRLARNKPRTFYEKVVEIIWATRLEFRCSKQEILAMYVSHAPFGGNVVGLDAAAWRYFGHPAEDLSWAESATLAVLPNAPAMIHLSRSRKQLQAKRNSLLLRLHNKGIIPASDYELAIAEPLPGEPQPLPQIAPQWVDYQFQMNPGKYTKTTVDRDLQVRIEDLAARWNREFSRSDIRNIAILVLDVQTNQVWAYCGNTPCDRERSGSQVDVIRSPRSSGSILKPFLYYAMLNQGSLLPHTLLPDVPTNINGFSPQNFSKQYEGAVPASEAIARSLNIPTVRMLQSYGVPKFYDFLKQAGLTTLNRPASHYGLSLILGGAEVTLRDVTEAYAAMARSLLSDSLSTARKNIFQSGASWQVMEALKEVNRPEEIDWRAISSMRPVAWKTGTSYGFRDAWAVGVSPRYAVGVWVGNATGEGKPGLVGARTAGPVLFEVFNMLPSSPWFDCPFPQFIEAEVCRQSGHLKGRFCEEIDTLLILPAGLRTQACTYHHPISRQFILPPAWEWYYKQHHPEYQQSRPAAGDDFRNPMQFIYPSMNARIVLPKQMDGSLAQITFELAHAHPKASVFWHLDQNYIGTTEDFHKLSIRPDPGKHSLTAVDNEGNTVSVSFSCH